MTKLLVLGLTVHCWEVPFVRSTYQSLEHRTKPYILRVSELFFAQYDSISKLVDYWKSLVLDNYWEKHFLVYTLPQFFTQPANLGFIKGRNKMILSRMCKAVLSFHLKYKLGCGAKRRPLKL